MNNWLLFTLIAPVFWGATNVLDGFVRKKYIQNDFYLSLFSSLFKLPLVLLLFFFYDFQFPETSIFLQMMLAGLLWGAPLFLYFQAFDHDDASNIAIYAQLLPIPTLILANIFLGEVLTTSQFIGFALMLFGGVLAATKKTSTKFHLSRGLLYMSIAVTVWAASDVYFKHLAVDFENYISAFTVFLFGSFLSGFFVFFMPINGYKDRNFKKFFKPAGIAFLMISIISAVIGSLSFSYALTLGKASLTTLATGLQPLFAIVWAIILKKMLQPVESDKLNTQIIILKIISLALLIGGLTLIQ